MNRLQKQEKGFTIIEVVLVLAIAALIFLMVFIALPALQRNQRDTQRKDDLARFVSQITNYESANNGSIPNSSTLSTFVSNYLTKNGASFSDPHTGSPYSVKYQLGQPPTAEGSIYYANGAKCNTQKGDGSLISTSGTREFAATIYLENGAPYCQDNQ